MFNDFRGEKKLLAIELATEGYAPEVIHKFLAYRVPSWALVYRLWKEKNLIAKPTLELIAAKNKSGPSIKTSRPKSQFHGLNKLRNRNAISKIIILTNKRTGKRKFQESTPTELKN